MARIKVSIIVPVFNAAPYLQQCLDSLTSQTLKSIEIILVNDGSTDDSGTICDSYAKKDARIHVLHQKNRGQTRARVNGVKLAKGNYVHFVDADDWLDNDMEKIMYDYAIKNSADIVTCDSVFHKGEKEIKARQIFDPGVYDKNKLVTTLYPRMIYSGKFFYFGIYAAMWNKLFRRQLILPNIEKIDPAVRIGEDGLATFASFLDAETVVVIKDTLYHYRDDNENSLTRSYCWEQFDSALLLIAYLRRLAHKHMDTYDISPQIDMYLLYNIKSIILEEFYYKVQKTYRHRYQYLRRIVTHPEVQKVCKRVLASGKLSRDEATLFKLIKSGHFHSLLTLAVSRSIDQRARHYSRKLAYGNKLSMIVFDSAQKAKSTRLSFVARPATDK